MRRLLPEPIFGGGAHLADARWLAAACGLLLSAVIIAALSPAFADPAPEHAPPILAFTLALGGAGATFMLVWGNLKRKAPPARLWRGLLLLGLALRLIAFPTTPILEDDWRRYLWEGAVVRAGLNPYEHPPADGLDLEILAPLRSLGSDSAQPAPSPATDRMIAIGADNSDYPEKVNHPYLSSVYPLTGQGAFLAANLIAPLNLAAWKAILAGADIATFLLLLRILAAYGIARRWALLYWLNPLLVFEIYNVAHMDILLGPLLLGAIGLANARRPGLAGAALAGAVGVKIWPALLAPLFARVFLKSPARLALFASAFSALSLILLGPLLAAAGDGASGLAAYAADWRRNAFLFPLIESALGGFNSDPNAAARALVGAALLTLAGIFLIRPDPAGDRLPARALILTCALFFLSPTGYPWYAIWIFILWPFAPLAGIGLLAATLPFYHLRFPNALTGGEAPAWLLAFEFGAPLAIIAVELVRKHHHAHP